MSLFCSKMMKKYEKLAKMAKNGNFGHFYGLITENYDFFLFSNYNGYANTLVVTSAKRIGSLKKIVRLNFEKSGKNCQKRAKMAKNGRFSRFFAF